MDTSDFDGGQMVTVLLGAVLLGLGAFVGLTAESVNGQTLLALLFVVTGAGLLFRLAYVAAIGDGYDD